MRTRIWVRTAATGVLFGNVTVSHVARPSDESSGRILSLRVVPLSQAHPRSLSLQSIAAPTPKSTSLYIVRLRSALPLAAYRGGIASYSGWTDDDGEDEDAGPSGLRATAATVAHEAVTLAGSIPHRARLSTENPQLKAYAQMLEAQQTQIASDVGVTSDRIVYSYKHASNGFAASLSQQQVWRLRRHPAVAAVTRSRSIAPLSIDSPTFLRMGARGSLWPANGGQASVGEGMVIGVVDSGIWPKHPSFTDAGLPSSRPAGWSGKCHVTREFKCYNKVIGARAFYEGFREEYGDLNLTSDWLSPRDSAAAGNKDVHVAGGGRASGMAPAARLAVYKATMVLPAPLAALLQTSLPSTSLWGQGELAASLSSLPTPNHIISSACSHSRRPFMFPSPSARPLPSPSSHLARPPCSTIGHGGQTLVAFTASGALNSSSSASATLAATALPVVANFSSTGSLADLSTYPIGAFPTNSILKPDIVGPGVDLYDAWPARKIGRPGGYMRMRGTSMVTPHLAGIAALIMQKHPSWSPAQVMSAICTTATTIDTSGAAIKTAYGKAATPCDMGSGHVFPPRVLDPGLTDGDSNEELQMLPTRRPDTRRA
ncbi:unnamed protein product [Closterium sp. NIES-65]|nr:unnamed protein product [Closterium sp. NIES-65]